MIERNVDEQGERQLLEPLLRNAENDHDSFDGQPINQRRVPNRSIHCSTLDQFFSSMTSQTGRPSCLGFFKWIPVIFVLSLAAWSYYAYVVQMCILTVDNITKKGFVCLLNVLSDERSRFHLVFYLLIYHVLLVLFVWSYLRTVLTKPRIPTRQFFLNETDSENVANVQSVEERRAMLVRLSRQTNLNLLTRHFDGSIRYCSTCRCIKPDRAHHCSICQRCVLRYDHHCPWTNSCISYGNYKYFVLFLGYTFVFCLFVAGSSLEYFIQFWGNLVNSQQTSSANEMISTKFQMLFLFFIAIMFAISVSSLFFYHLYLTSKNRTTLESFRAPIFATGPEKNGFNLGCKRNFQEIFGDRCLKTLLPIPTSRGDGIHFQVSNDLITHSLDEQQTLTPARRTDFQSNDDRQRADGSLVSRSDDFVVNVEASPSCSVAQ